MSKERIKSEYFSLEELTHSSVGTASGLANEPGPQEVKNLQLLVTAVLDPLRRLLGRPITVTSGYRCRLLNTAVHGSPNSQHLTGQAADITTGDPATNHYLAQLLRHSGIPFDQLIAEYCDPRTGDPRVLHVSYNHGHCRRQFWSSRTNQ